MKIWSWIIVLGFLGLLSTLGGFLISGSPLDIFTSFFGIYVIITGLAMKKGYFNSNIYYSAFLSIIIFQGLTLIYTYIFTPVYVAEAIFYINSGILILFAILFVYMFIHRQEYTEKQKLKN